MILDLVKIYNVGKCSWNVWSIIGFGFSLLKLEVIYLNAEWLPTKRWPYLES